MGIVEAFAIAGWALFGAVLGDRLRAWYERRRATAQAIDEALEGGWSVAVGDRPHA